MPLLGAGVLGVLQQAVPVALLLEALRVGEHPGHQPGHRVGHHHGGQLAAGEHEVADGDLLVHTLLNEPLVDALIVPAHQNQVVVIVPQAAGVGLHEGFAGGGHVDGMSRAEGVHNVLPALVEGVGLHDRAVAAAVGIVVHLLLLVEGVIPDLVGLDANDVPLLGAAQDGLVHHIAHGQIKEGHNIDPIHRYAFPRSDEP